MLNTLLDLDDITLGIRSKMGGEEGVSCGKDCLQYRLCFLFQLSCLTLRKFNPGLKQIVSYDALVAVAKMYEAKNQKSIRFCPEQIGKK